MIELMREYTGITALVFGTVVYMLGIWRGSKVAKDTRHLLITTTSEVLINDLIESGFIRYREEEQDGEMVFIMMKHDE